MKTLAQFKLEERVSKIDLMKGQGRAFAQVNEKNVIVSEKCDMTKPLFVTKLEADKDGNPLQNVYAICNSTVELVASI
jgi:hypothetical protein